MCTVVGLLQPVCCGHDQPVLLCAGYSPINLPYVQLKHKMSDYGHQEPQSFYQRIFLWCSARTIFRIGSGKTWCQRHIGRTRAQWRSLWGIVRSKFTPSYDSQTRWAVAYKTPQRISSNEPKPHARRAVDYSITMRKWYTITHFALQWYKSDLAKTVRCDLVGWTPRIHRLRSYRPNFRLICRCRQFSLIIKYLVLASKPRRYICIPYL